MSTSGNLVKPCRVEREPGQGDVFSREDGIDPLRGKNLRDGR
jgi:hypothetical protein